jgi:hypothetical protein
MNNIKNAIKKRQEAIIKHIDQKKNFLIRKEKMLQEIEKARLILKNTMEQLPKNEFQGF